MTVIGQALRPARIRQFARVARTHGLKEAVGRARGHLGAILRSGGQPIGPRSAFPRMAVWSRLSDQSAFHPMAAPWVLARRRKVVVIGDLNLPQCRRFRVEQMAGFWEAQGVAFDRAHVADTPRCIDILQDATHLVLYRVPRSDLASLYLYEARRLRLPVVYDIDDPLFSVPACRGYGNHAALPGRMASALDEAPLFLDAMNMADAVTVSTPGLVAEAARFTPRPVWLRRNFPDPAMLDAGRRAMASARRGEGLTLALASGSEGRAADAGPILGAVSDVILAAPRRRLLLLGRWAGLDLPRGLEARTLRQGFREYEAYLGALASADLALVPLADDPFNRCKSAVRAMDAAAAGVAAVVSEVGDAAHGIAQGLTGWRVAPGADWGAALAALAGSAEACRAMGEAARAALEARAADVAGPGSVSPGFLDWVKG